LLALAKFLCPWAGGSTMTARVVDARKDGIWPDLADNRLSSLFSSLPWIEVLARTYDFKILASASPKLGKAESAILFSLVSDLRGDRVVCLPFSDYCDPLVEDSESWSELIEPILAFGLPITLRCLHNDLPVDDTRFSTMRQAMWHEVDLKRSEEELWQGFTGSARQNVRRAKRNGVVVREGRSLEMVRTFYRMHLQLRKSKYRLLAQPAAFFDNLHQLFAPSERLSVLLAEVRGTPVAGIFFLQWGDTLYYKFNASVDSSLGSNDLLMWEGIRWGRGRGFARLDLGLSDPAQPGLIRYKQKYATRGGVISMLRWQPSHQADGRSEQIGHVFNRLTHLLTDPAVPDEITAAGGDELYRFFC
jgi:CelD/BcsL family acetyltransferase involved in cellulose biosynthesis